MADKTIRALAHTITRERLSRIAGSLGQLPAKELRDLSRAVYADQYQKLAERAARLSTLDEGAVARRVVDHAGRAAGVPVDRVGFPGFVRDLLQGVFDANVNASLAQMEAYQDLLRTASRPIAQLASAIDDTAAFESLAERQSDDFTFDAGSETGGARPTLRDRDGNIVAQAGQAVADDRVKAKIKKAKTAMAREQRALLRETILMGIARLVVEQEVIEGPVSLDVTAGERIEKRARP